MRTNRRLVLLQPQRSTRTLLAFVTACIISFLAEGAIPPEGLRVELPVKVDHVNRNSGGQTRIAAAVYVGPSGIEFKDGLTAPNGFRDIHMTGGSHHSIWGFRDGAMFGAVSYTGNTFIWDNFQPANEDLPDGDYCFDDDPTFDSCDDGHFTVVNSLIGGATPVLPTANFTFTPAAPVATQVVAFADTSGGNPTSWSWDFGDAASSALQNPTHVFTTPGTFSITLTATNAGGSDSKTKSVTVTPATVAPVANFSWSPSEPKAQGEVQFSDTSTGLPTSWAWAFGDGGTSNLQNPSHVFGTAGNFSVTLTATNSGGSHSKSQTVVVGAATPDPPAANFSWSPSSPKAGDAIQFTDTSTGTPTAWSWTFGDGGSSSGENPKHTYPTAGAYSVKLTATNAGGSTSKTRTVTVAAITPTPVANFIWSPSEPKVGEVVQFSNTSTGDATSWLWDFDDGETSLLEEPLHVFVNAGAYAVKLTVMNAAGSDSETKNVTVGSGCPVQPLPPPPFDEWEKNGPPDSTLRFPAIAAELDAATTVLLERLSREHQLTISRGSGYRPIEYQKHFHDLRVWFDELVKRKRVSSAIETQCAALIAELNREIDAVHGIVRNDSQESLGGKKGAPKANPPFESNHTSYPAQAIDLKISQVPLTKLLFVDRIAEAVGLFRPCGAADPIHFQLKGTGCDRAMTVIGTAHSPVAILLTGADGRRIGFDGVTRLMINEFGESGYYSGPYTEPQEIVVTGVAGGTYTLSGMGAGVGSYQLDLYVYPSDSGGNDPEDMIAHTTISGNAVADESIKQLVIVAPEPEVPVTGPSRRRSVRH